MLATRPPLTGLLRAQRPREGRSDASIFVALFSRSPTRPIPVRFVCVCFACPSVRAVRVRARTKTWERGRRRLGCPLSTFRNRESNARSSRRGRARCAGIAAAFCGDGASSRRRRAPAGSILAPLCEATAVRLAASDRTPATWWTALGWHHCAPQGSGARGRLCQSWRSEMQLWLAARACNDYRQQATALRRSSC